MNIGKTLRKILKSAEDIPILDVLLKSVDYERQNLEYGLRNALDDFKSIPFASMPREKVYAAYKVNSYISLYKEFTGRNYIDFLSEEDESNIQRILKSSEGKKELVNVQQEKKRIPQPPLFFNFRKYMTIKDASELNFSSNFDSQSLTERFFF